MPIINTKYLPEPKTVRLIDLTEDSINKIAEAVVSKLNKSIKHGYWINSPNSNTYKCSICGEEIGINKNLISLFKYCPMCGAKMNEVEE